MFTNTHSAITVPLSVTSTYCLQYWHNRTHNTHTKLQNSSPTARMLNCSTIIIHKKMLLELVLRSCYYAFSTSETPQELTAALCNTRHTPKKILLHIFVGYCYTTVVFLLTRVAGIGHSIMTSATYH